LLSEACIRVNRHGSNVWAVTLRGEHDVATAPRVTEVLHDLLAEDTRIIVDLTSASFIDSTILKILLEAHSFAGDEDLVIVAPDGCLPRRVIDLVGLSGEISVHPDLVSASAALGLPTLATVDGGSSLQ